MAGDPDRSRPLFAEALRIGREIDDRVAQYCLLDALGCCAIGAGQARLAARLLGAAETVRTEAGATLIGTLAPLVAKTEESAIMPPRQRTTRASRRSGSAKPTSPGWSPTA
jgi:hypothetical protein